MNSLNTFVSPVFRYLQTLPKGKVTTYGAIAKKFGIPNARNVGWVLRQNDKPDVVPCYKVVRSDGRLAGGYKFGGMTAQAKRLLADGNVFKGNRLLPAHLLS